METGEMYYRRYLDGDPTAFDGILQLYRNQLTFFINRFVRDLDTAEDLAIDTFMYLIVHRHRYNFKTSLKTYLFMIGRSRALDYLRHQNRFTMVELSDAERELPSVPGPEESILREVQKQELNRAMDTLPQDMQTVLHLVYFEELSYEEAAKVMRKNKKQVANLLYRAKAQLRAILGREGALT